eukprot:1762677-Prymnesium_polylepis.1
MNCVFKSFARILSTWGCSLPCTTTSLVGYNPDAHNLVARGSRPDARVAHLARKARQGCTINNHSFANGY